MTSSAFEARRPWRPSIEDSPIGRLALAMARIWMYIGGPIVLYNKATLSTGPSHFPLTEAEHGLIPAALREYLDIAEDRLSGIGFGPPTRARMQVVSDLTAMVSLFEHPVDGAIGGVFLSESAVTEHLSGMVWFCSSFADGTYVSTSNSQSVPLTPTSPEFHRLHFPGIDDAAELYELHRIRVKERSRSRKHVPMTRGTDPLVYQDRDHARTVEHWVRCGYYRRTTDDALRHTVRGAVLSAWRGMFPWRQLTEAACKRERDDVLRRRDALRTHGKS
ncbi:MAG TPA: hypothetical protein VGP84_02345, partial [Gemmatimonadaceae bacterium]|nr:hypothetical protein [Gemmatimonadaceae bacterium]